MFNGDSTSSPRSGEAALGLWPLPPPAEDQELRCPSLDALTMGSESDCPKCPLTARYVTSFAASASPPPVLPVFADEGRREAVSVLLLEDGLLESTSKGEPGWQSRANVRWRGLFLISTEKSLVLIVKTPCPPTSISSSPSERP